jgi:hypothetical protein
MEMFMKFTIWSDASNSKCKGFIGVWLVSILLFNGSISLAGDYKINLLIEIK